MSTLQICVTDFQIYNKQIFYENTTLIIIFDKKNDIHSFKLTDYIIQHR